MSNGFYELPNNRILNPKFTEGLRNWSHSGDVTVRDWPTPVPPEFASFIDAGRCVALGPGGELGQLLGFMPTQHDLWFGIQADEATPVDLTVTVKYTDRDMNVTETIQTKTESDFDHLLGAFNRIEVPLERDTYICHFNVVNNASEGQGIAPVYLGVFYLQVEYPEYANIIDPRFLWLAMSFWRYFAENPPPEEPRMFRPPPPMNAMLPEGKMLAAQIFELERKLARLTKRLGLQEEVPGKSTHPKKPKKSPKGKPKKRSGN
jgi:hypothetical protein